MKSLETPSSHPHKLEPNLENLSTEKLQKIQKNKSQLSGWLIAILLLAGGVTLWKVATSSTIPTAQTTQAPPPRPVEIIALKSGTGNRQVKLLGQVEAGEIATLSSQIDGRVERVLVKEGDRVTTGMAIAIIDDADARLAIAEAQARLAQEKGNLARLQVGTRPEIIAQRQAELNTARARELEAQDNLARVSSLTIEGALSERALVEARTQVNAATSEKLRIVAILAEAQAGPTQEEIQAQQGLVAAAAAVVQQAELERQRSTITANFSGIVQSKNVNSGDYVEQSDPIVTIVSDRSLDIFLEIPESLTGQVAPGMPVQLNARALPNWQEETTITAVIPTTDAASRRQLVRIGLNNPQSGLLPGMAIQGNLTLPVTRANTFVVPRDAVTRRGEQWLLFTVNNDQAKQIEVEIVADLGQEVVIANSQLQAGQTVVLKGGDGLTDNATVKVINN